MRDFLRRPATWGAVLLITVALLIGFGIGLATSTSASHDASTANRAIIREIGDRQHEACMKANDALAALRGVVTAAFAPGATTRVQAPPFPEHPEVEAYIQRLLDSLSANSNSSTANRDRVLAAIPADTDCAQTPRG